MNLTDPQGNSDLRSSLQTLYAPKTIKLAVMSFTTLGFYLIYWGYKNWTIMRASGRTTAWPLICGLFLPFTMFSLLDKIRGEARDVGVSGPSLTAFALGFLLFGLFKIIPVVGILSSTISFLAVIPINKTFTKINAAQQKSEHDYENFTALNVIWLGLVTAWMTYHVVQKVISVN